MDVTLKQLRVAALINLFDIAEHRLSIFTLDFGLMELRDCIRNELWCLRNDLSTEGLEDITLADTSTSDLLKIISDYSHRTPDEQSAMLICTLQEIS